MPTAPAIEVRDMRIVHRTFRSAFDESARLVRAAPAPSSGRVAFLADHIDFGIGMLHHHHRSEDLLLWPKLLERAPEKAAMVSEVAAEHEEVAGAVDAVSSACASWRGRPDADTAEALAAALDELDTVLQHHLDDEESKVVPLAAVTLTQEEWNELGAHAREGIPRDRLFVAFGMLLDPLDEEDTRYMLGEAPAPVRLLWRIVGRRTWRRYADTLRTGT